MFHVERVCRCQCSASASALTLHRRDHGPGWSLPRSLYHVDSNFSHRSVRVIEGSVFDEHARKSMIDRAASIDGGRGVRSSILASGSGRAVEIPTG